MPGIGPATAGQERGLLERLHIDPFLLLVLYLMAALGVFVLYSAGAESQYLIKRQMVYIGIGTLTMFAVAQIPPMVLQRLSWVAYTGGLLMLLAVLVAGSGANGAQRWVDLGIIQFQPSEVIKFALPMFIASYLSQRTMPVRFKHLCWALVMICIPVALILYQPDLGTGILVAGSGFVVLFLAGLRWRYILSALALAPVICAVAWIFLLHDYQKQRVLTMFNPEADKLGAGWNIIQSTTAIGSGGWSGKGWMLGTQSHLDFLPESHTDFIIAVLAEEFGFRGVLFLLVGYLLLFIRGLWISYTAKNSFSRLVAGALTFIIFLYVFVNMGMVSGILPVVGVPLPLFSYGGTALVSMFIAFGVLMAISTEQETLHAK
ncbi:MAG: rod shape-determining protein RodA [Pseudomonadales bacterium]